MKRKVVGLVLAIVLLATAGGILSCGAKTSPQSDMVRVLSDGRYDFDYSLVGLTGTNPVDLANYQRAVLVEGFIKDDKGQQQVSANVALGWIYEGNVVVPIQLFFAAHPMLGLIPAWQVPGVTFKAQLLPDSRVDDEWQKEELGDVTINEKLMLAVIKRNKPVINNIKTDYTLGKYEDLAVGNALYVTGQANGRMTVEHSVVSEVYADSAGRNLFNAPGEIMLNELGALAFTLRDGKPELVGFLSAMEPMQDNQEMTYFYYTDIRQVINFVKTSR